METTPKQKVEWEDLIELPSRIRPTGPWGHGWGRGRGRGIGRLPSEHITSLETLKYICEAAAHTDKAEKVKEEKQIVCKQDILQKAKRDRLVKKMKVAGEL